MLPNAHKLKYEYIDARNKHRKIVRENKAKDAIERDKKVSAILSKDPWSLFKQISHAIRNQSIIINKLNVGNKHTLIAPSRMIPLIPSPGLHLVILTIRKNLKHLLFLMKTTRISLELASMVKKYLLYLNPNP